jgi:hypothetical protein
MATTAPRESVSGSNTMPSPATRAPNSISGSRPRTSDNRPAKGRKSNAVIPNAPKARPAPASSAPMGPVVYRGNAWMATPTEVK